MGNQERNLVIHSAEPALACLLLRDLPLHQLSAPADAFLRFNSTPSLTPVRTTGDTNQTVNPRRASPEEWKAAALTKLAWIWVGNHP